MSSSTTIPAPHGESKVLLFPLDSIFLKLFFPPRFGLCKSTIRRTRKDGLAEIVDQTTDVIRVVRKNLEAAQSRQKSYADPRLRPLEFAVGDKVFIKVSPWKGKLRFGRHGKLTPRYIGPFPIEARVGELAYRIQLPERLQGIHNVFHLSMLRRYVPDPSHELKEPPVELTENVQVEAS